MAEAGPGRTRAPLLGPGASFSGLVVLHGDALLEGSVRGEIVGAEILRIGESARVEASIQAEEVVVAGTLEGELRAGRRVELLPTARVRGSIDTPRLALADGCVFEGRCTTRQA